MRTITKLFSVRKVLILASVVLLTACAGPKYAFQQESFDAKGPFDHHFDASKQVVFETLKRVALRQGFAIEHASDTDLTLVVSKQYQNGEDNTLLTISGLVTGGDSSADTWVAAQEVTLKSHSATQTASVGILLGLSIPVPTGTVATLTKERGQTVMEKGFYDKIYAAITKEIPSVKAELDATNNQDDSKLRADIEKKMRIEMEIRAKLDKEEATTKGQSLSAATPAAGVIVPAETAATVVAKTADQ